MLLNCGVREDSWRVPWTARRSNLSILKEISSEYSLEGLMLKLRLQYFGHLMRKDNSVEKTLMLGKIDDRRRRGWQRMRWLDGIIDSMDMNLSKHQGSLVCCSSQGRKELDMTQQLSSNILSRSVFTQNQVLPSTFSHFPHAKAPYKPLIWDIL